MVDIHSHILPGVDDGATSVEESLAMARLALAGGTTGMICTSHSTEWLTLGPQPTMVAQVAALQAALQAADLPLRLWPGLEIFLTPDTPGHLRTGRAWTLAGSQYVLVEVPYDPWPPYADQILFQLQVDGYWPILAHPERYVAIQRDPTRMVRLAERGILGQVTAGAFAGHFGDAARRLAITLCEHNLVQFLASDTHSATGHRRPDQLDGYRALAALLGPPAAAALATTHPHQVLTNTPLVPDPRPIAPRRSYFTRLFGGRSAP